MDHRLHEQVTIHPDPEGDGEIVCVDVKVSEQCTKGSNLLLDMERGGQIRIINHFDQPSIERNVDCFP